jgi:hypothetical protein
VLQQLAQRRARVAVGLQPHLKMIFCRCHGRMVYACDPRIRIS